MMYLTNIFIITTNRHNDNNRVHVDEIMFVFTLGEILDRNVDLKETRAYVGSSCVFLFSHTLSIRY